LNVQPPSQPQKHDGAEYEHAGAQMGAHASAGAAATGAAGAGGTAGGMTFPSKVLESIAINWIGPD
jgi:hypothetical protein